MRKHTKINVLLIMAFLAMFSVCSANAQSVSNYDLQLNLDTESNLQQPELSIPVSQGQFQLTLVINVDNNISEDNSEFDYTSYLPAETSITGYNPVITIDNSYYSNETSQDGSQKNGSFTLSDGTGKWQFSGAFERKYFNQLDGGDKSSNNVSGTGLRASVAESSETASSESADFKTSLASSYHLEVVYRFKPTVKGKVSFTQSTIDDYDTGKSIQAEAIVESRPNVQIKAGVQSKFENDAMAGDVNLGKDNKVYTEFILKF